MDTPGTFVVGDYDWIPESSRSDIGFRISVLPVDLLAYWRRCGLLANFAAAFLAYRGADNDSPVELDEETYNLLSTLMNELIENAAKYSREKACHIGVEFFQSPDPEAPEEVILTVDVTNEARDEDVARLKELCGVLFSGQDLEELYLARLAEKDEDDSTSGFGLMVLMKDFPVKIGVKIVTGDNGVPRVTVRAHVRSRSKKD